MSGTKLFASTSWSGSAAPPTTGGHLSLQLPFDLDDAGQDDLIVKADAPKALRKGLSADMPKIGHNCVRENGNLIKDTEGNSMGTINRPITGANTS